MNSVGSPVLRGDQDENFSSRSSRYSPGPAKPDPGDNALAVTISSPPQCRGHLPAPTMAILQSRGARRPGVGRRVHFRRLHGPVGNIPNRRVYRTQRKPLPSVLEILSQPTGGPARRTARGEQVWELKERDQAAVTNFLRDMGPQSRPSCAVRFATPRVSGSGALFAIRDGLHRRAGHATRRADCASSPTRCRRRSPPLGFQPLRIGNARSELRLRTISPVRLPAGRFCQGPYSKIRPAAECVRGWRFRDRLRRHQKSSAPALLTEAWISCRVKISLAPFEQPAEGLPSTNRQD